MAAPAIREYLLDLAAHALVAPPATGATPADLKMVHEGAQRFRDSLGSADQLQWEPSQVGSSSGYTAGTTPLGEQLIDLSPSLPWIPARQDPTGDDRALLPVNSMFDIGDIIAGFVLVRPSSFYPLHQHPPQELYLTIDGTGDWRFGGAEETTSVAPGHVFYNPPGVLHEQRNGPATNISFYILWP